MKPTKQSKLNFHIVKNVSRDSKPYVKSYVNNQKKVDDKLILKENEIGNEINLNDLNKQKVKKIKEVIEIDKQDLICKKRDIILIDNIGFIPEEIKRNIKNSQPEEQTKYPNTDIPLYDMNFSYITTISYNKLQQQIKQINETKEENLTLQQINFKTIYLNLPHLLILQYIHFDFTYYPMPADLGLLKFMIVKFWKDCKYGPKQNISIKQRYLRAKKLNLNPYEWLNKYINSQYFDNIEKQLLN